MSTATHTTYSTQHTFARRAKELSTLNIYRNRRRKQRTASILLWKQHIWICKYACTLTTAYAWKTTLQHLLWKGLIQLKIKNSNLCNFLAKVQKCQMFLKGYDDDDNDNDDIIIKVQGGLDLLACSIFKGNRRYEFTIFYISLICIYLYQSVYTEGGFLPSTKYCSHLSHFLYAIALPRRD